jgi:hypothetical protein
MKLASSSPGKYARARDQKFFRRKRDAMGVGVIQQAAMVGLRNQAAGSAPGFFMLPAIRRRQCRARDCGHLGLAAEFPDDGCCRIHAYYFGYSEIKVKAYFGKSELLSFLKFRNMAACWISG